ncbi:type I secretion system permease/ATPase [Caulobacter segnis]|uniref:Type I secretion system permease/ATPase n=1 Tax=Caulobacter segnis TaxID=88688 RepID=A0ABM6TML5_9CAUL|nr:type I secretion system permease/ATPase [Caulobacter segnis]AVQ04504.1 type I secretion system permease/ATPase [Caulobacter segnis]
MFNRSGAKPTILDKAVEVMKPAVITAMVFSFFINILALVSPLYMLQVYDRVLSSRSVSTLVVLTVLCVFLFLIYGMLEALRTQVLVRGGLKFDGVARDPIFKAVLDSTLTRRGPGGQAFRDMDQVREFATGGLIAFCDAPWTPVFIIVSWMLHPYFGILAIISCFVIFGLAVMNDRATKNPLQMATMASIAAQNDAGSTLRNAEVMKAMGMWGGLQERWRGRRDEQIAWQAAASDSGGAVMSGIKVFRQIVQTLILGGGAYLAIEGKISPGAMIAGSILVGRALAPIEGAVGQWKVFLGARGAWDRLQGMLRDSKDTDDHMPLPDPRGVLSAEAASILPPGAQQPTMRQASFRIDAGTSVALVGPSAAGKSSLLRGIVGVWPCAAGVIRLDGYDIKQWDPERLGRHIGYLPQDIELFSGTVAQNIARFTEYESQEVIDAATLAGVHDMIQGLPMGYDTAIGEGGASLSGGQRQRLALARAVFRMPALLVLDEPNASLDQVGELALMEAMNRLKAAKRTVVFATHKVNLLAQADYIMVINQGVIADFGERDVMLAKLTGAAPPPQPPKPAPIQSAH